MHCKITDCFTCPYPDCINDYVRKTHRYSARDAERRKERYEERKEAGLCPYCGKRPPSDGYKTCDWCRAYYRQARTKTAHKAGVLPRMLLDGIDRCAKCGKQPPKQGYKLCERCYGRALAALKKTPTHNGKKLSNYFTQFNEVFYAGKTNKV